MPSTRVEWKTTDQALVLNHVFIGCMAQRGYVEVNADDVPRMLETFRRAKITR
jgi:hypothetical protein